MRVLVNTVLLEKVLNYMMIFEMNTAGAGYSNDHGKRQLIDGNVCSKFEES